RARAGRPVVVLERRERVGGACVTEELWPGFQISRAAYVAGLLRPVVARELRLARPGLRLVPRSPASFPPPPSVGLARHGLRLIPRSPSSFTPLPDGRGLLLGAGAEATRNSIAAFSRRDA